ncbi:MAG: hypothetical protein JKY11_00800 [Alphaproteobacteria bacterium]|nr:hypothetical protein [Alphaproteobacteria bacterium]
MFKISNYLYRIFFLFSVVIAVSLPLGNKAQASCECQWTGTYCAVLSCPDLSIFTCAPAVAAHAATNASTIAAVEAAIQLHAIFLRQRFMTDGIIAGLTSMAEQISIGHSKQAELMSTMITSRSTDDTKRAIQKKKYETAIAGLPSEEHCQFATMSSGLIAAEYSAKAKGLEVESFFRQTGLGNTGSVWTEERENTTARTDIMCKYADPNIENGALADVCAGVTPSDEDTSRFLLASNMHEYTLDDTYRETINSAMLTMFFENQPDQIDASLFANDTVKMAYIDHRSVLSRQMLAASCFQKTFEDKLGGSSVSVPYQSELLTRAGLSAADIQERLGPNPSSYAQKKLLIDMVMDPTFGISTTDTKENVLRLSSGIQSYKMTTLFDTLEILHCNELILSQLLNDKIKPISSDLQERFDIIEARIEQENSTQFAKNTAKIILDNGGS